MPSTTRVELYGIISLSDVPSETLYIDHGTPGGESSLGKQSNERLAERRRNIQEQSQRTS